MTCPFPGMDPFIEGQKWRNFHARMIVAIGDALVAQVAPRYDVDVEESVYLQADSHEVRYPDVSISRSSSSEESHSISTTIDLGAVATIEPRLYTIPDRETFSQRYLEIRDRETRRLVTAIEVLSPTNKNDGYTQYLRKRGEFFISGVNVVELDLLRGGRRLPTTEPLMAADYFAFVACADELPRVSVYGWSMRQTLPTIPIPLSPGDPAAPLDLQDLVHGVYDRAGFAYSLDYSNSPQPPLGDVDSAWIREILRKLPS
ncbi:MAG: DUF4058 family protein [Planctomycetales bacterium]|nr:DUF4058 family protein [Planctomycetales bacterium]